MDVLNRAQHTLREKTKYLMLFRPDFSAFCQLYFRQWQTTKYMKFNDRLGKHSAERTAIFILASSCCYTSAKVVQSSWTFPVWSLSFFIFCRSSFAPKWLISDHSHLQTITANIINLLDPLFPVQLIFLYCWACYSVIHHFTLTWSPNTMRGEQHVLLISHQCLELTKRKVI